MVVEAHPAAEADRGRHPGFPSFNVLAGGPGSLAERSAAAQESNRNMKILITGSAGHLGEALVRTLQNTSHEVVSLDVTPSPFTSHVGSLADRHCVRESMRGVHAVLHAAALHKPHLVTHGSQDFVATNITGTL